MKPRIAQPHTYLTITQQQSLQVRRVREVFQRTDFTLRLGGGAGGGGGHWYLEEQHSGRGTSKNKGWELSYLKGLREAPSSKTWDPQDMAPSFGPQGVEDEGGCAAFLPAHQQWGEAR